MKVVGVVSSLRMGGAERVMAWLLSGLATRGNHAVLITSETAADDFYLVDPLVHRRSLHDEENPGFSGLRRTLAQESPDVVVSFLPRGNVATIAACRPLGIPVVVGERTDPRREPLPLSTKAARRALYPFASAVVVQTSALKGWARRAAPRSEVAVIPNPMVVPSGLEFPWPRKRTVVGVGRLEPLKRFDWLISAFAASPNRDNFELRIVGDGPERTNMEQRISDYRLDDRATLVGAVSNIWEELAQAQIFVLSSEFEGFPNALMEAMAAGCAVVSVDCPCGPSDLIQHRKNGLLVPSDSPEGYRTAVSELMSDPTLCEQLGTEAQKVTETYAPHRILNRWEDLLRTTIRESSK